MSRPVIEQPGRRVGGNAERERAVGAPVAAPDRGGPASPAARAHGGAAILFLAPAVMLAGFAYHPHVGDPIDADFVERIAAAVAADTMRWGVAHLMVAVGSGLLALAFLAVRALLREAGEERWSSIALPFVVMGSTLYALLPAMEFAPLTAATSGSDIGAAQAALYPWFVPILFTSAVIFAIGAAGFAFGIARSRVLRPGLTRVVVVALIVMAISRLVPLSLFQFHVQGLAGLAALWPLAFAMWTRAKTRSAGES